MNHWQANSECVTHANELTAIANYCTHCTVRLECLITAIDAPNVPEGVWGGLTQRQRIGAKRKPGTAYNPDRPLTPHVVKALEELCDEREKSGRRVPASRAWSRPVRSHDVANGGVDGADGTVGESSADGVREQ